MQQKTILVVGSLNMDQVVQVPRVPVVGETLVGAGSLQLIPGGKGANQAVAAARLGGHVLMAGRVGTDPFGQQLLNALRSDNIITDLMVVDQQEASGTAFIFLLPDGDNAIIVSSGANARVGEDDEQFQAILGALDSTQALVLQLEIPLQTIQRLVSEAAARSVPVILNLAPAQQLPEETLRQISTLVVNESEASLLTGQNVENLDEAKRTARQLHSQGIATVVVTLGARGALLVTDDGRGGVSEFYQEAPKVEVVDTTAAGDCFVGALTVALSEGQAAAEALRFAVYASALKVTRFGAQSGLPGREEVLATYYS